MKFYTLILLWFFALFRPAFSQVPVDHLLLDLPLDGNASDISGYQNNGTLHNTTLDTNRFGVPNTCLHFDGVSSYIEIPASPSLNKIQTSDVISITAWINIYKWHASGNVFSIFERYNPVTDEGWLFEANWASGGILFLADETSISNNAGCNFSWNFHQWYHLGLTYSQTEGIARFYVDGAEVCATPLTSQINVSDTTAPFVIGRSLAGPDEYSDGLIDDYKVYDRILTANEIEIIHITERKPNLILPGQSLLFQTRLNTSSILFRTKTKTICCLTATGKKLEPWF